MQETLNFLNILDNRLKRPTQPVSLITPTNHSSKERERAILPTTLRRNNKFPYAKAIEFTEEKFNQFPSWITKKEGFLQFMYQKYEAKLLSIPKICEKIQRASDQKYFVGLFLQQIDKFKKLPTVINQIILSKIKTRYFKAGELIHFQTDPIKFIAVIFVGSVQFQLSNSKTTIIKQKNDVILTEAFYKRNHPTVICKEEAVLLTLDVQVYHLIQMKLKQQIQGKEKEEIADLLKSTFFQELHLKDKKARAFYQEFNVEFFLKNQVICDAGEAVRLFYMIYKGSVIQQNHIYIREHNKWPLPNRRWQVRAVYNSYNQCRGLGQFQFFGDEQIIGNTKFKSKFICGDEPCIIFSMPAERFKQMMTSEDMKRLKKYRSEHVDINYSQFEKSIRDKVRSQYQKKRIIHKAIDTSFANKKEITLRKMSLVSSFEKEMLKRSVEKKEHQ